MKCGKELPKCARCSRADADCLFPEPPDRKLLATYRSSYGTHTKRRKKTSEVSSGTSVPPSSFTALLYAAEGASALEFQEGSCADINSRLSHTLRHFLIDVYFTHMYNAWLIFHRPTLLADIDAGLVSAHVLVSIYATATMYVPYLHLISVSQSDLSVASCQLVLHSPALTRVYFILWAT